MGEKSSKGVLEKLVEIRPQYIHAVTIILMVFTLTVPMTLPVQITDVTRGFYNMIDKLPDGSKVLIIVNYTPASFWEVGWGGSYALDRLARKLPNVKFVAVGFYVDAAGDLAHRLLYASLPFGAALDKLGKKYGTDFVNFGWLAGGEAAYAAFAADIPTATKRDYYGNRVENLPLMKDIKTPADFQLILGLMSVQVDFLMRQIVFRYSLESRTTMAVTGESVTYAMPYIAANQIQGALYSVRGVAEYEGLLGKIGIGTMLTNATSLLHTWLILLIVLGNVIPYVTRGLRRKS